MNASEATPGLKPRKHSWYSACFMLVLLTAAIDLFKQLITRPAIHDPLLRIDFVAELLGRMLGTMIFMVPGLLFVLALLFFFDGWFSRTIVGIVLAGWTVLLAVNLSEMIPQYPFAKAQPAAIQPPAGGADSGEPGLRTIRSGRGHSKPHPER